ncbi:MAG: cbb3-type cytochrome c oxidase subunit 3 [Bacteroidota bacterium]
MISKYLSSIDVISIFPIIGLIVFFGLYIFIIVKTVRMDKKNITQLRNLPLEDNKEIKNNNENEDETK